MSIDRWDEEKNGPLMVTHNPAAAPIMELRPDPVHIALLDDEGQARVRIYPDGIWLDDRFTLDENAELFVNRGAGSICKDVWRMNATDKRHLIIAAAGLLLGFTLTRLYLFLSGY